MFVYDHYDLVKQFLDKTDPFLICIHESILGPLGLLHNLHSFYLSIYYFGSSYNINISFDPNNESILVPQHYRPPWMSLSTFVSQR